GGSARQEVVDTDHLGAVVEEALAQVGSEEPGTAGDDDALAAGRPAGRGGHQPKPLTCSPAAVAAAGSMTPRPSSTRSPTIRPARATRSMSAKSGHSVTTSTASARSAASYGSAAIR